MKPIAILIVSLVAISAGIFVSVAQGHFWAINALPLLSLVILAATFASPWSCNPNHQVFWSTYVGTAILFGIILQIPDNIVSFVIRDSVGWLNRTSFNSLVGEHYHIYTSLRLVMAVLCPFVLGISSAFIAHGAIYLSSDMSETETGG